MSGYRQSSFDPGAYVRQGPPLRPYNWVQWTGVALALAGIAFEIAFLAAQAGWIRKFVDSPMIGSTLVLLAIPLVNSRRQQLADPAPELASQRRRWTVIIIIACAFIIGAAALISAFTGA